MRTRRSIANERSRRMSFAIQNREFLRAFVVVSVRLSRDCYDVTDMPVATAVILAAARTPIGRYGGAPRGLKEGALPARRRQVPRRLLLSALGADHGRDG